MADRGVRAGSADRGCQGACAGGRRGPIYLLAANSVEVALFAYINSGWVGMGRPTSLCQASMAADLISSHQRWRSVLSASPVSTWTRLSPNRLTV